MFSLHHDVLTAMPAGIVSWILTYLIHSTALWLLAKLVILKLKKPADEELLWRSVLLVVAWLSNVLSEFLD